MKLLGFLHAMSARLKRSMRPYVSIKLTVGGEEVALWQG